MDNVMQRFLASIGLPDPDRFDLSFEVVLRNPFKREQLDMVIVKDEPWNYDLLSEFLLAIARIDYPCTFDFHYKRQPTGQDMLVLYENWHNANYRIASPIETSVHEESLAFKYESEQEKTDHDPVIVEFKELLKFIRYDITLERIVAEPILKVDEKAASRLVRKADKVIEIDTDPFIDNDQIHDERRPLAESIICADLEDNYKRMEEERKVRNGHHGDYQALAISGVGEQSGRVDVNGRIFSFERKDTTRGKAIRTFGVGDDGHGIHIKAIGDSEALSSDRLSEKSLGCYVRVRGVAERDTFANKLMIMAHTIDFLPHPPFRADVSPTKRVELHLHTCMSAMDATGTMDEYCEIAKSMGHEAIAITDHGVVQGFPAAQAAAKKHGLKMIYGVEMYMIDDETRYIMNPADRDLETASYVAFDLETTGLSTNDDRIIEFGAVRVHKGQVIANLDILINPGKDFVITQKIQELTNISPDMLVGKPAIEAVMPEILEFIGSDILVSHNAAFDVGFMNEALKRTKRPELTNPIVDTLALSRNMFAEASSHRLGSLARRVEVLYEEGKAHRADYDAAVLAQIWVILCARLINDHRMKTHGALAALPRPSAMLKNLFPQHTIVLARNAVGLKDLFKLITLSHTEYWSDVPRIPRYEIDKVRKNLLIGSACFNGELFELASNRTIPELEAALAFYDYVELQPLENYRWLIEMGGMDHDRLLLVLRRIIEAATKAGKPIVATGDVHYADPEDKLFRDVYVYAKGLKGVNHPLMPYSRENRPPFENPDQHFRSTDEMLKAFAWLPEAQARTIVIDNSRLIAAMIEPVFPVKSKLETPKIAEAEPFLTETCYRRAKELYGDPLPQIVEKRLQDELKGIIKNGYAVIYYIANKIIKRANDEGYIVGSRGSVGSSFVATMAAITEVNPLPPHYMCPKCRYSEFPDLKEVRSGFDLPDRLCPECLTPLNRDGQNIPFATFLGFEAEKVPDIDLNFPPDYQARAHDFTRELLGAENIYRAGTIETVAEKTAYGYAKGYYERRGYDLEKVTPGDIAYLAAWCQGVKRTTGQHPGGLVVVPTGFDIHDFTPVQFPADKSDATAMTTHFEFSAIHDTVLKLDLLGHVDPLALKMMTELTGVAIADIPMNDPEALSLFHTDKALKRKLKSLRALQNGALGIPEFGTNFVMGMLNTTKPKTFGDLVILSGLSHGRGVWRFNAEDLIGSGKAKSLADVIGCRDDIMTYLIDKGLPAKTAFAIMEDVRKGKKVKPEFAKVMKAYHVPDYYIDSCNKIEYMFPKAHATAYVTMAVRVAWFKVHHPLEYYATFFSLRAKQFDLANMMKPAVDIYTAVESFRIINAKRMNHLTSKEEETLYTLQMALEMAERGYRISNIDLDKSSVDRFLIDKEAGVLIPPFIVMPGIGDNAATSIAIARAQRPFLSRDDLLNRTKLSATNLEDLANLGALDHLDESNQISLFSFGEL